MCGRFLVGRREGGEGGGWWRWEEEEEAVEEGGREGWRVVGCWGRGRWVVEVGG